MASLPTTASPHIVLFPFMSKGHTIPLIHLAHLLFRRGVVLTIFTTPANSPFICSSLASTIATVVEFPFPEAVPELPAGVESSDQLPSMTLFLTFVNATKLLLPRFEQALQTLLPHISCIISDGFLGWTQLSASKFNIPRLVFYGMSNYAMTISRVVTVDSMQTGLPIAEEPFSVSCFPWIKLSRHDLNPPFDDPKPEGPLLEFIVECTRSGKESYGMIANSFYELESIYVDYWNREIKPRIWCVGPLCLTVPRVEPLKKTRPVQWLKDRLTMQRPVLYVAFGTQTEVSEVQLQEIVIGLERSGVDFLWVVRSKEAELGEGFEERVAERGLVVREWVEQTEILGHKSVKGFLSHCGWNSVLESICAGVPILAWPMMADQYLNAKMVVEELGIGLRIGQRGRLVKWENIKKMVSELMVGEKGMVARTKVREVGEAAKKAMEEGGSSYNSLDSLIDEITRKK